MTAKRSILITGGDGLIGSNFIHYILKKEPDVFLINLDALTYAANLNNLICFCSKLPDYKIRPARPTWHRTQGCPP
jgi:dTDP-D-glucose 4,6-dehydratase